MLIIAAFNILSVDLKRAWAKGFAACNEIGEMECGKRDIAADLFSLLKTPSPAALEPETPCYHNASGVVHHSKFGRPMSALGQKRTWNS